MKVLFHPRLRKDIRDTLDYYDQHSVSAGDLFYDCFEKAIEKIKSSPTSCPPLDTFRRRCNLEKFPFHIVYEMDGEYILITVLRHHKRHPSFGLQRKW